MSLEPLPLYKLIVLFMLNRVESPLAVAQISDFIVEKNYTDFITLQQVVSELKTSGMVDTRTAHNRTLVSLTQEGKDTLSYFQNRINPAIQEEILVFLKEHEHSIRSDLSVKGEYYKASQGDYEVHLSAMENQMRLMELTLSMPSREMAAHVCDNWQKKNQSIYQYLMQELL